MKIVDNKMKPSAIIQSRNKDNKEIVYYIGLEVDDLEKQNFSKDIYLLINYKGQLMKVKIKNEPTDKYDYIARIGERYIVIDNHIYFIDDIEDMIF